MNDFLLYELKISVQFMETLRIVIDIVKYNRK
jgi:hypothetical protein